MAKKTESELTLFDIPLACLCTWEKRIVLDRGVGGIRTEIAKAVLVWINPTCTLHKGKQ